MRINFVLIFFCFVYSALIFDLRAIGHFIWPEDRRLLGGELGEFVGMGARCVASVSQSAYLFLLLFNAEEVLFFSSLPIPLPPIPHSVQLHAVLGRNDC